MPSGHHLFWVTDEFMFAMFVAQIGTMKCFYCPQKDVSLVSWDFLSPADQTFLRDKCHDAAQGTVCDLCVGSASPSAFFGRRCLVIDPPN